MKTRIIFLLDRSGSMRAIYDDTVGGFNTYLEELAKADNADDMVFTRIQFDSGGIDTEFSDVPVKNVPGLDKDNFKPRDMTPLLEAATKTIEAAAAKSWDGKTIIVFMTDGQENSSKPEYTNEKLAQLIAHHRAEGWEFVFLGAGIDAYGQASKLGIGAMNTMSYNAQDKAATLGTYRSMAANTQSFAKGEAASMSFSDEQKMEAGDQFAPKAQDKHLPKDHLQVKL